MLFRVRRMRSFKWFFNKVFQFVSNALCVNGPPRQQIVAALLLSFCNLFSIGVSIYFAPSSGSLQKVRKRTKHPRIVKSHTIHWAMSNADLMDFTGTLTNTWKSREWKVFFYSRAASSSTSSITYLLYREQTKTKMRQKIVINKCRLVPKDINSTFIETGEDSSAPSRCLSLLRAVGVDVNPWNILD